jgi:hypothetical protein
MGRPFALADVAIEISITSKTAGLLVVGVLASPINAYAYRPFDSTDAAVADLHAVEVELSPLSYRHDGDGVALIAPSLRLNYGFAQNWEVVLEGEADNLSYVPTQVSEAMLSVKTMLREGSLQGQSSLSLASEATILLPGIGTQNGAGLEWTGIASQRGIGAPSISFCDFADPRTTRGGFYRTHSGRS